VPPCGIAKAALLLSANAIRLDNIAFLLFFRKFIFNTLPD
jgi:hypothetical protein